MSIEPYIPYGKQDITQDDIDMVVNVLKSDFLTQGPCVSKFEKGVSEYCSVKHAVAVNSATSALHLACLSLGLSNGDWLWTSPITFVASANCGLYCGAKVDFIDIDPDTYNLCPKALKNKLIHAKKVGKLPKIVIPVHLCGQSCDMKAIHALSEEYNFKIIEDASHAIGGKYLNESIGNCKYSDITVFSFHPVKIITTGEGGMALTNNSKLSERMSLLSSHGTTRNPSQMTHEPDGDWYYQQVDLGFNYRMTDIQAALGLSQLERLDDYIARRHNLANRYNELLSDFPLIIPYQHSDNYSAFHLYIIRLKDNKKHKQVFEHLRKDNIGVNLHYIPVHTQPYYNQMDIEFTDLEQSELYYKDAISLPLYPAMTEQQQDIVISSLRKALQL
ncbi:UDP-4-amino-4,6-dideoxy-N-acetyl-beta-L-altrosamine transaminase [Candidatus Thioglobus sp.]|nr:UDP-4-amino-4,6-dideoxy-N-acetyl-beta-L-altrosamine transaminase [Candidatus Thioglobus sp.]MDC1165329.1 UDP-4-amino-4,6-dideoxy-N-acetyl-beta-L-altrosamine transaminase [Candidatus Thioglobus sp.]